MEIIIQPMSKLQICAKCMLTLQLRFLKMLYLFFCIVIFIVACCFFQEELDTVHLQLQEKHSIELASLSSSMSLSFQEELLQVGHKFSPAVLQLYILKKMAHKKRHQKSYLLVLYCFIFALGSLRPHRSFLQRPAGDEVSSCYGA